MICILYGLWRLRIRLTGDGLLWYLELSTSRGHVVQRGLGSVTEAFRHVGLVAGAGSSVPLGTARRCDTELMEPLPVKARQRGGSRVAGSIRYCQQCSDSTRPLKCHQLMSRTTHLAGDYLLVRTRSPLAKRLPSDPLRHEDLALLAIKSSAQRRSTVFQNRQASLVAKSPDSEGHKLRFGGAMKGAEVFSAAVGHRP